MSSFVDENAVNGQDLLSALDPDPVFQYDSYSEEEKLRLLSIQKEAEQLFPSGTVYPSPQELRVAFRKFSEKKGFSITTNGSTFHCSRCEEPPSHKNKRAKKEPVPLEKQRKHSTTRVGCPFFLKWSPIDWRNKKSNPSCRITSTSFLHDNGCNPSLGQLQVEKRKAGTLTTAIHELQIKSIMTVLSTGTKVPTAMLREMMKPLYPPGTSLDWSLVFN